VGHAKLARLIVLQYALIILPALALFFALDGPLELRQTLRDVSVVGQERLASTLGLLEIRVRRAWRGARSTFWARNRPCAWAAE
jgi:hypothetical protein